MNYFFEYESSWSEFPILSIFLVVSRLHKGMKELIICGKIIGKTIIQIKKIAEDPQFFELIYSLSDKNLRNAEFGDNTICVLSPPSCGLNVVL